MAKYLPKKQFLDFCNQINSNDVVIGNLYKAGIDIIGFSNLYNKTINGLMEHIYGEQNYALITDWLYGSWNGIIYDKDHKIIKSIVTAEELWEYLEQN